MSEPKRKKILIPTNQYQDLELLAKKHDLTVDQLVDQLLEKEIAESAKKEIFRPGLKWAMVLHRIFSLGFYPMTCRSCTSG